MVDQLNGVLMNATKLKKVLLKISGRSLMGVDSYGIDVSTVDRVAKEISQVCKLGIENLPSNWSW